MGNHPECYNCEKNQEECVNCEFFEFEGENEFGEEVFGPPDDFEEDEVFVWESEEIEDDNTGRE